VLAPATAAADEVEPSPPACALLDRADGVSRAGVALGWSFLNDADNVDFTAFRFDVHGQWVAPGLGVGGYAILPVSYGRIDPEMGANNAEWVIGDVELGAVARRALLPELEVAAHVGVTLPTAPAVVLSADDITGFASSFAIWARPNDLVQAYGEASYLRMGVSPMRVGEGWFARADVAVDVPLHSGAGDDLTTIGRLNGAIGARVLRHSVWMLEIVNLMALEEPEREGEDRWLTFVGLTGAFATGRAWQPVTSLLIPLDDEVNDTVDMVVIVGVEAMLP
jgi:hypothetical protein